MSTYRLPIKLESEPNLRGHWTRKHRRSRAHRKAALMIGRHSLPCVVTITRVGKRMLDSDNLVASAKFLRDAVADRLGVDDADPRVEWRYEQRTGPPEAIVEIQPTDGGQ